MIDSRELRKDPETYVTRLARKGADILVRELLVVDAAWRAATNVAESLRARLKLSGEFPERRWIDCDPESAMGVRRATQAGITQLSRRGAFGIQDGAFCE